MTGPKVYIADDDGACNHCSREVPVAIIKSGQRQLSTTRLCADCLSHVFDSVPQDFKSNSWLDRDILNPTE